MENIKKTLNKKREDFSLNETVNSYKKPVNNGNNSLTTESEIDKYLRDKGITSQGKAKYLAEILGDSNSLRYYQILIDSDSIPNEKLFEAMSITKDAYQRGVIRSNKAIYFQAVLKNWGYQTKFKKYE